MPIAVVLLSLMTQTPPPFGQFAIGFEFAQLKTFRCQFSDGEGRLFSTNGITNRRGEKISGEVVIDQLNYTDRTARIIGNAGADDAAIFDGDIAATLIITTPFGGLVTTTLFKTPTAPFVYRVAMSRHLPLATGEVNVTQLYGTCRGLP